MKRHEPAPALIINYKLLDTSFVKAAAASVGFDACGIAAAGAIPEEQFGLEAWLRQGCHADMYFMEQHRDMRHDPRLLVPGAQSVISVLLGYKPSRQMEGSARIAQYAYGEDYHERVKRMLYRLIARIQERYPDFSAKPCVDTAPISDKLWAARAGLGWIGRNTLLVNPDLGSYCYIGELVTTAPCDHYDTPMENRCADCTACLRACPNQALGSRPSSLLSRLSSASCASYHTIENRAATLPAGLRLSGYAFGCDCCQLACPYNRQARICYDLTDERKARLESLATADEPTFRHFAKHSALSRIKYPQWLRNRSALSDDKK